MRYLIAALLILFSAPALAQQGGIVIDLAEERVDIESDFSGKNVIVFGHAAQSGDIAITLEGPQSRIVMRQRQPVFGMWLNRHAVDFKRVPIYYDYATTRSEKLFADAQVLQAYNIGLNNFTFNPARYDNDSRLPEFQEALIRTQQSKGFYPLAPQPVAFVGQGMFRTTFQLPANIPVGNYRINAYLFNDGQMAGSYNQNLQIAQAGMSATIYNFADDYSIAYAMTGLIIAILAGFGAYWVSRRERI